MGVWLALPEFDTRCFLFENGVCIFGFTCSSVDVKIDDSYGVARISSVEELVSSSCDGQIGTGELVYSGLRGTAGDSDGDTWITFSE